MWERNETRDTIAQDARRDPDALARETDLARADIDRTLAALERRLSPSELLDRALGVVRRNGGEFGTNFATQVRNNPVPALLTGVGLTWLLAASNRAPVPRHDDNGRSLGDSVASAASSASATAGATRASAREAVATARRAAGDVAERSRTGARRVRDGYRYLRHEQPLVLGALAVAAGAAIGVLLPHTDTEDRWLGEASDTTTARISAEGRTLLGDESGELASRMSETVEGVLRRPSERIAPGTA